ncbi:DUF3325 domain-containing protein [Phytopseudomonas daroniae]|nr:MULTISPECIES: DUF3325 domain-containing protein [Pseudomonas]
MIMLALALTLNYSGMALLCLGLARHYKQIGAKAPPAHLLRALRIGGWLALALGFCASAQAWGWAMGSVAWCGLASLGGLLVALLLPYRPRLALNLAGLPVPLSLALLL